MQNIPEYFFADDKTVNGFFGDYRWLSNFWLVDINYRGIMFSSVESAYQAAKCENLDDFFSFKHKNPAESRKAGKTIRVREDWAKVKYNIMFYLVMQKFSDNIGLCSKLKETENRSLIEANNWGDKYWGISFKLIDGIWVKGEGFNRLGMILHDVREILK